MSIDLKDDGTGNRNEEKNIKWRVKITSEQREKKREKKIHDIEIYDYGIVIC